MNKNRKLVSIYTPKEQPGFLGAGHTARPVVAGSFRETDPFIFLMDDILDKKDEVPVGGAHPHAGFETVSLLLEGQMGDGGHVMKEGDFELMTAGSGVVHTEIIDKKMQMRLLQLWLNLPKKERWVAPRLQNLPLEHVPVIDKEDVYIKLYSGSLAGITSPFQNYTPLIIADVKANRDVSTVLELPADYNTFLYVIEGSMQVGVDKKWLYKNQVGWVDYFNESDQSSLKVEAGKEGVRFVLYAGKPTGDEIVSHGPFIADTNDQIQDLYRSYRQGQMEHIANVSESQRIFL